MSRNSQVFYNIFCTKAAISVQKKSAPIRVRFIFSHAISVAHILTPVEVATLQCVYQCLSRSDIGRNRDIMNITQTQKIYIIRLVGLCIERVAEEHQQVYLVAGYAGCKLLIATLRAA